jgi:hypothetical protein
MKNLSLDFYLCRNYRSLVSGDRVEGLVKMLRKALDCPLGGCLYCVDDGVCPFHY